MMAERTYLHAVIYLQHNLISRIKLELKRQEIKGIWGTCKKCVDVISKGNMCRLSGLLYLHYYCVAV